MNNLQIRLAEDSDNDQILELNRKCPQEGMITLCVNRSPCFNSLHRLLDPESWHLVACSGDRIIGLIGIVHFQGEILGKDVKIAYILDLKVDSAYRSGTVAYRLVKSAVEAIDRSDTDFVIANFIKDNKKSLEFTKGRGKLPRALYLGSNKIRNLLPVRFMKPDKRFEISTLREQEIPEIVQLYRKYSGKFKISPAITEERFRRNLNSIQGLTAGNFFVAKDKGEIKAFTACWDEHFYKSYQVLKLTPRINLVNGLINVLSNFMKLPQPIRINEPLRQLSIVYYAHDDCPKAMQSLFKHINNITRGSEYTLITLYSQENDPISGLLKNFRSVSVNTEMYLFAKDTPVFEKLNENPSTVLFDLSMIM